MASLFRRMTYLRSGSERFSFARKEQKREAGLTDVDILDANLTVSYFAYVNRLAQGLGVEVEPYVGAADR